MLTANAFVNLVKQESVPFDYKEVKVLLLLDAIAVLAERFEQADEPYI